MSWQLEFDDETKVVCLTFRAIVSKGEVHESCIAVISMVQQMGTHKILTDLVDVVEVSISTVDVVLLPDSYKLYGLKAPFREAVVAPRGCAARETAEFYETVCVNRGNDVRVFELREHAMGWLAC